MAIPSYAPVYTKAPTPDVNGPGLPLFKQTINTVNDFVGALDYAVQSFYILIGIVAVIYLIYSGVRYITANGNKDSVAQARQGIIYAVLGIIIIMTSYAIIAVIAYLSKTLQ